MGATAAVSASSMISAYGQSEALKTQGQYQERMADLNAKSMEWQADQVIEKGNEDASAYRRKMRQLEGKQKVAMAAGGLDTTSGSAAELLAETQTISVLDQATIKNNAYRAAWGLKSEASNLRGAGEFARVSSESQSRQTLVTGGLNAVSGGVSTYYNRKR
jgi:hypothetical protein